MQTTPKSLRLHITFFGRRNAGKSSLLNALVKQKIAIVSDTPGTTTDPVEKPMELLPLGPVVLIDTAGIDDQGDLGELRVEKTWDVLNKTDLAILVSPAGEWTEVEQTLLQKLQERHLPIIVIFNKSDIAIPSEVKINELQKQNITTLILSSKEQETSDKICQAIIKSTPEERLETPAIVGDLVKEGDTVILVIPIDFEAPKGRIILPQVQTIRDLLDHHVSSLVVQTPFLAEAIANLKQPPALVITDSQAFKEVEAIVPKDIPLTSFSIAFARLKGDLKTFIEGANQIDHLCAGDSILIMESCTHHPQKDDIGREKIPRWLTNFVKGQLDIHHEQGQTLPNNLQDYKLIIHCGSCMFNRQSMLSRIQQCRAAGVPITNYGMIIAKMLGILERTLEPFTKKISDSE